MPKLFDTLAVRYQSRPGGYTRIHKLPPRYGDMAPLAILELVDGKRDMQFSMTARRVARSLILGTKWLSETTKEAMYKLLQSRGVKTFDEEVERQKTLLMKEDKMYEAWKKLKEGKSVREIEDRVYERALYTTSKYNRRRWRELEQRQVTMNRKDSHMTEEEKEAERQASVVKTTPDGEEEGREESIPLVNDKAARQEKRAAREQSKRDKKAKREQEREAQEQLNE